MPRKIGVNEIIHARDELEKEIENFTISDWYPIKIKNQIKKDFKNLDEKNLKIKVNQLKSSSLKKVLKRLFRFSDKVYFVDAFLPDHIMGNNLKDLTMNVRNVEFYHGIRNAHLKSITKEDLEIGLKKFFKEFKLFKSEVYVKHREAIDENGVRDKDQFEAYDKALYDRMIITFLDSENIAIIEVKKGLNIIKGDDTIKDRNLAKKNREWSKSKMENEWIYVEKSGNFLHFNTGSIKY